MASKRFNYYQEYDFSPEELASINSKLSDDLLQQYIQDKLAKSLKEVMQLDHAAPDLATSLADLRGESSAYESLIRVPG